MEEYKNKLLGFDKIISFCAVDLFRKMQFSVPREHYGLMMEMLKRMKLQLRASADPSDDALESVPIFLTCIGADIQLNKSECFDDFIDIGKTSSNDMFNNIK